MNCWRWRVCRRSGAITFEAAWRIGWAWEVLYTTLNLDREPAMTRFLASQLARTHTFDISAPAAIWDSNRGSPSPKG